jgi:hypothetical protein
VADMVQRAKRTQEILAERTARSVEVLLRADEQTEPQKKIRAAYEAVAALPYEQFPDGRAEFDRLYPGQWPKQAWLEQQRNERERRKQEQAG